MKKLVFAILSFIILAGMQPLSAETVMHKEAKTWAQTFFNAARGEVTGPVKMVYNGKDLTTRSLFTPFFIYNSTAGGFVIISGENKTFPILGYSLTESFDTSKLDSSLRSLLKEYARQIELIRYDSTVPERAIEAWTNKNRYINSILSAESMWGFSIPDEKETSIQFEMLLDALPDDDSLKSDLYTVEQWNELVKEELLRNGSVVMGINDREMTYPLLAVGLEGNYVKFQLEGFDTPLKMMAFPSEVFSSGLSARLGGNPVYSYAPEETPFAFHDEVMEMSTTSTRATQTAVDELLSPASPVIRWLGSGHFEIDFPTEISLVRVFNIAGHSVKAQTYAGTTRTAVVNIEDQPNGFYIIACQTANGTPYALKVAR